MRFSEFQDLALYHPQAGFYAAGGSAGRGGDFITSPEVGSLFGMVLASALDTWWAQMRRPDPFVVVEAGAGVGTLASAILDAEPECLSALRYVMVERSTALRSEQAGRVALTDMDDVFTDQPTKRGIGPFFCSAATMPTDAFQGVIFSNELLDNLAIDLVEYRGRHWNHVCVGNSRTGELEEVLMPIAEDDPILGAVRHFGKGAVDGARLAMHGQARDWLDQSLSLLEQGRVVAIDYGTTSGEMLTTHYEEWLRTYRNHRPGTSPLDLPGTQDITCDVAFDQLEVIHKPVSNRSQAAFLNEHGLRTMVSDAREVWHGQVDVGDLGVMRARARVQESRALTDEEGLGGHRVVEWEVKDRSTEAPSETKAYEAGSGLPFKLPSNSKGY